MVDAPVTPGEPAVPSSSRWFGVRFIAVLTVLCAAGYGGYDVVRYLTYHSSAYDLAFFDQVVQNIRSGRGFTSTFIKYDFLGQHWEPILLAWAQFSRISPSAIWLVLVNSCALALAPWAAWRLARTWYPNLPYTHGGAALLTAASPLLLRAAAYDYHSEALTPVLALLGLVAAHRRQWVTVAACCAVLALVKEDAFLVIAGLGWLMWCVDRQRIGLVISAIAGAAITTVVVIVMPTLRGGVTGDLLGRYAYLDTASNASPRGILIGTLTHPITLWTHLTSPTPLAGLAVALLPLCLLPLLSGRAMVAIMPVLAVALLSADRYQSSLQLQYGVEAFPLLLACSLIGLANLMRHRPPLSQAGRQFMMVAPVVVFAGLIVTIQVSVPNLRRSDLTGLNRRAAVETVLAKIPAQSEVAASIGLVAHVSNRKGIWEFPGGYGVEYVVIDSRASPSDQSTASGYASRVRSLSANYQIAAAAAGVTLWRHR